MARSKQAPKKTVYLKANYGITKTSRKIFKEIKRLQSSTELCMPKLPFSRLVREIFLQCAEGENIRVQALALKALQEASEMYLTTIFEDANRCCHHAKRVTLQPKDMQLTLSIRGTTDPGYGCQKK